MNTTTTPNTVVPASTSGLAQEYEDQLIVEAINMLTRRLFNRGPILPTPDDVRRFLQLKLMSEKREQFAVVFCDYGHRVTAFEVLALFHNAATVILAHNNPSGRTEPSEDDRRATVRLKAALELIDVRILDHIIIGEGPTFSFAELGLL